MFIESFDRWRWDPDNKSILGTEESQDNFDIYYMHYTYGMNYMTMFADLAYQIYELQVCVEGLIEHDLGD